MCMFVASMADAAGLGRGEGKRGRESECAV